MESKIRYCKKCHCELSDYSKGKLCDNCRKRKNNVLLTIAKGIGAVLVTVITVVITAILRGSGKSNNNTRNN